MVSQLFRRRALGLVASAAALSAPTVVAASNHAPVAQVKRDAQASALPTMTPTQVVGKGNLFLKAVLDSLDKGRKNEASPFEPPGKPPGRPPDPPGHNDPPNPPGKPPDRPPDHSNGNGGNDVK